MLFDFDALKKEVSDDFIIDTDLSYASIDTAKLYSKYLNRHLDAARALRKELVKEKKIYRAIWEYYSGKSSVDIYAKKPLHIKILKTDLDTYIETDNEMISIRSNVDDLKKLVSYLEKVLDQLKNRGFLIKNALDYEKFKNGGY